MPMTSHDDDNAVPTGHQYGCTCHRTTGIAVACDLHYPPEEDNERDNYDNADDYAAADGFYARLRMERTRRLIEAGPGPKED